MHELAARPCDGIPDRIVVRGITRMPGSAMILGIQRFVGDDAGYLSRVFDHPTGSC
jgi:hypothetical protein